MIKMKIPSLRLRKRVLFLPFGKAKGSMALEGSLALPLFLFFMMTVLLGLEAVCWRRFISPEIKRRLKDI